MKLFDHASHSSDSTERATFCFLFTLQELLHYSESCIVCLRFSIIDVNVRFNLPHTVGVKSMSPFDIKLLFGNLHNITALHHNTNIFSIEIK